MAKWLIRVVQEFEAECETADAALALMYALCERPERGITLIDGRGCCNPQRLHIRALFWTHPQHERDLHDELAAHRLVGEWFAPAPAVLETVGEVEWLAEYERAIEEVNARLA